MLVASKFPSLLCQFMPSDARRGRFAMPIKESPRFGLRILLESWKKRNPPPVRIVS